MTVTLTDLSTKTLVASLALVLSMAGGCTGYATGDMVGGGGGNPGDNGGSGNPGGDTGDTGDNGGGDELGCAAADSYATVSAQEAEQALDEDGDPYIELDADLSSSPLNQLEVSLWTGSGAFTNTAIGPGTYPITGEETSYDDCGACAVIWADVDPITDDERQMLMAQSGTIQIDSVTGTVSGSLENVVFKEVDPDTGVVKQGGCESTIASLAFSAPL